MTCSAFTVGKLFPARYSCDTRLCSKLVHCSCMTLCSLVFDLFVIFVLYQVKRKTLEVDSENGVLLSLLGAKYTAVVNLLLTLSKSGGLAVSAIWVLLDLRILLDSAPGQGSLILGSFAVAASLLNLLLEFSIWMYLLPTALKNFSRLLAVDKENKLKNKSRRGQDNSGSQNTSATATLGFSNNSSKAQVASKMQIIVHSQQYLER